MTQEISTRQKADSTLLCRRSYAKISSDGEELFQDSVLREESSSTPPMRASTTLETDEYFFFFSLLFFLQYLLF